jgi:hypothetical protein
MPETQKALITTLKEAGWQIAEFKDHGGGITLTLVPLEKKEEKTLD